MLALPVNTEPDEDRLWDANMKRGELSGNRIAKIAGEVKDKKQKEQTEKSKQKNEKRKNKKADRKGKLHLGAQRADFAGASFPCFDQND